MAALHLREQGKGLSLRTFLSNCPRGLGVSVHPRFGLGHKGSPPGSTALSQWELAWGAAGGRELVAVKREESICADSLQQPKAKASLRRRLGGARPGLGHGESGWPS